MPRIRRVGKRRRDSVLPEGVRLAWRGERAPDDAPDETKWSAFVAWGAVVGVRPVPEHLELWHLHGAEFEAAFRAEFGSPSPAWRHYERAT
jgi:hypothetical protein